MVGFVPIPHPSVSEVRKSEEREFPTVLTSGSGIPVAQMGPVLALSRTASQQKRRQSQCKSPAAMTSSYTSHRKIRQHCDTNADEEADPDWLPSPRTAVKMHERDDSNGPTPGVIEDHQVKQNITAPPKSIDERYCGASHIQHSSQEDVPRTAVGRRETESKSLPTMPCSYEQFSHKVPAENNPDSRDMKALRSRLASNLVGVMSSAF